MLLEELTMFLIDNLSIPKLAMHSLNTFANKKEIRTLYKGIRLILVDCYATLNTNLFLDHSFYYVIRNKKRQGFFESRNLQWNERKAEVIHPFRDTDLFGDNNSMPIREREGLVEEFDLKKYKTFSSTLKSTTKPKNYSIKGVGSDGRIWINNQVIGQYSS